MFFQKKIHSCFITRGRFERFKLQKRLILCLVKELRYYCTHQGLWLGEVGIKEPLGGCQIRVMNQKQKLSGYTSEAPGWEILGRLLRTVNKELSLKKEECWKHWKQWLLLFNFPLCGFFFNHPR